VTDSTAGRNLRGRARLIGLLYIPYIVFSLPLTFRGSLVAPRDAAATATNIVASQGLYRLSIFTDLVGYALYVVIAFLFYSLLRTVSRPWAAVGTLFTLLGCFVLVLATAMLTAPVLLLDASVPHAIGLAERQELGLFALKAYNQAYAIALFYFGAQWLVMGPLFARLIPRPLAYLLFVGGVAGLALAAAILLGSPARTTVQYVALPIGALAETSLAIWLLVRGVEPRNAAGHP
jgi:hypothetical protein